MGYFIAGFDVVGIDIEPQPGYPFKFVQTDALTARIPWHKVHAVHASPPCRAHSWTQRIRNNDHDDLVAETRAMLQASGKPYVIENVEGAPLIDPVTICGAMFREVRTYRHRLFETSFPVPQPKHPRHIHPVNKMGRAPKPGEFMYVVGNFIGAEQARDAMGIPWMTRDELREAIPPAYTRYIGKHLKKAV